jgi:arylsulfatase A-like enzyme/Flp pilus assembly protein TadD
MNDAPAAPRLGALLLAGAATLGCVGLPRDVRREPGLSVLLITIDTLRADALGAYGNARAETPWIDRLAAHGVRFEQAHAQNVVTLPSHANILSGLYPLAHGIRDNGGFRFPPGAGTLATLLEARGYRTGAFVSAFPLDSRFGLDRGFGVYDDRFSNVDSHTAFVMEERRGSETVALAREWIAAQGDAPYLCWVHLYDPHFPYDPPEPYASRFAAAPYHGEVAAADAALAPLLEPLLEAGRRGRTLVVLTSDHGESLGEHGEMTHGIFAYEATLRVPLILYQPRLFAPRVVAGTARHVDVLPTVLDALALPLPEGLPGRSLLPAAAGLGEGGPETVYFEALSGQLHRGWAPLKGVLRDGTKYVELPIPELYDLRRDPGEADDLAAREPGRVERMRALLAPFQSADARPQARAEARETLERLRSLGYLTGAVPARERYTELDDPKRLIAVDALLHEVVGLSLAGERAAALERCRELVRRHPRMALGLLQLALLERESGELAAAAATLRRALTLNPQDTTAAALLGATLTQLGRAADAVALLEPFARRAAPDLEVLTTHALALASLGRPQQGLASLARGRELDASNAMLLVGAGTIHVMAGDAARAREAFAAALALNPGVARAHSSLGVLAAEGGRVEQAIEHWRAAVRLDPREHEKLLTFGLELARRGRIAQARPLLEFFAASAPRVAYARELERVRSLLAGRPSS